MDAQILCLLLQYQRYKLMGQSLLMADDNFGYPRKMGQMGVGQIR